MQQFILALVTAGLAAIGFLLARIVRRDRQSEALNRRLRILTLHRRMEAARLSLPDLKKLERDLSQ
jgi:hypothetical protein